MLVTNPYAATQKISILEQDWTLVLMLILCQPVFISWCLMTQS